MTRSTQLAPPSAPTDAQAPHRAKAESWQQCWRSLRLRLAPIIRSRGPSPCSNAAAVVTHGRWRRRAAVAGLGERSRFPFAGITGREEPKPPRISGTWRRARCVVRMRTVTVEHGSQRTRACSAVSSPVDEGVRRVRALSHSVHSASRGLTCYTYILTARRGALSRVRYLSLVFRLTFPRRRAAPAQSAQTPISPDHRTSHACVVPHF